MNTQIFEQAKAAYDNGNYPQALNGFVSCLKDPIYGLQPGEMGMIYHQIGNCLVKENNSGEAIQAYTQALADGGYDALGAVHYNLGMAYASLRDYEHAVQQFNAAVADGKYETPFKAYSAMGSALMKLGRSAEAGVAFRESALDPRNPDPTKSLLNLGVCFMALNRPLDAVVSYESALQFDMSQATRNKLYSNLGQAYASCGQMQKAVHAFEEALSDGSYFLSDSASVDYQRAIGAVAQGTAEMYPVEQADMSGFDVVDGDGDMYDDGMDYGEELPPEQGYYDENGQWHDAALGEERFFNATDEEIEQFGKENQKENRKRRNVGLKILVAVIIVLILLFGAGIAGYVLGFGFPSQQTAVTQLFANPQEAVGTVFVSSLDETKAKSMAAMVVQDSNVTIDGMNKSMSETTLYATAKTPQNGSIQYKIILVRDLIGWKISSVDFYFTSQDSSSSSSTQQSANTTKSNG